MAIRGPGYIQVAEATATVNMIGSLVVTVTWPQEWSGDYFAIPSIEWPVPPGNFAQSNLFIMGVVNRTSTTCQVLLRNATALSHTVKVRVIGLKT